MHQGRALTDCATLVPDHLSMLQTSREPWDTSFVYRGINKPIVHEEVCHTARDETKENLALYVKQRNQAKVANDN